MTAGWHRRVPFRAPWNGTAPDPKDVVNDAKWELYDLTKDWTQNNDVAAANPDEAHGTPGSVLDRGGEVSGPAARRFRAHALHRAPAEHRRRPRRVRLHAADRRHPARNSAEHSQQVVLDQRRDRSARRRRRGHARHPGRPLRRLGLLPPQGQAGLRLQSARPRAAADRGAAGALSAGKHTVEFVFTYDGPGLGKGGTGGDEGRRRRSGERPAAAIPCPSRSRRARPSTSAPIPAPASTMPTTCRRSRSPERRQAHDQARDERLT